MLCKKQEELRYSLYKIIDECFSDAVGVSLGFGSFWQNYHLLRDDSDVDFFVLLNSFPKINNLYLFCDKLDVLRKSIKYTLSCHLFVGSLHHLVSGEDNIIRILNIYSPEKSEPVNIMGSERIDLLSTIRISLESVDDILQLNLFRTTRFILRDFVANSGKISYELLFQKYKQLNKFFECYKFANNKFFNENKSGKIEMLEIALADMEPKEICARNMLELVKRFNDIVLDGK